MHDKLTILNINENFCLPVSTSLEFILGSKRITSSIIGPFMDKETTNNFYFKNFPNLMCLYNI